MMFSRRLLRSHTLALLALRAIGSAVALLLISAAGVGAPPVKGDLQTIAHRGSSADRPENTLASVQRAIEAGATAVEVDLRLTRDSRLVLLHDATLDRTTNGSGPLAEKTLAEVHRLDAGSWFDSRYSDQRVPTLKEVLNMCEGKIDVLLDLKLQGDEFARAVAAEVKAHGSPKRTIVGVRSVEQARLFRRLLPESRQLGLIPNADTIEAFAEAGVETIRLWPKWLAEDATLAARVRKAGAKLHLNGTTGRTADILPLLEQQPDSLSSDDPARLVATLAALRSGRDDHRVSGEVRDGVQRIRLLPPAPDNPRNSEGDFIRLKDGRLLLVYTHFTGGAGDHARAFLAGRISDDGGKSWTAEDVTILPNEAEQNIMSVSLVRLDDGRIALFYLRKNSLSDCRPLMRTSEDEARSWSEPVEVVPEDEMGYYVLNNDRVIQLEDGRLVVPLAQHHGRGWAKWVGNAQLVCYYSDDRGRSWKRGTQVPAADPVGDKPVTTQEPGVVALKDGRLMLWCRTDAGSQYVAWSRDGAESWSKLQASNIVSPLSPATIERIPSTGDLLLIWNDHRDIAPALRGRRTPLCAAVSTDDGRTWKPAKTLEDNPHGWYCYTAMSFVDDHVLLAHCAGDRRENNGLALTQVTRFPVAWLYEAAEPETARDRLWIWGHAAGVYNDSFLVPLGRKSSIEPVDAARRLGLENMIFVRYEGRPAPPFDDYYRPFEKLDRVYWSLVGASGATSEAERDAVYRLAERHENVAGFILDDFFRGHVTPAPGEEESQAFEASLTPEELRRLAQQKVRGRTLPIMAVVYTGQISPRAKAHLAEVDQICLWTWRPEDLKDLETNLEALEKLVPDKPIFLGCYMYDFADRRPLPVEHMQRQTELGYGWLKQGRIEGIIFLATPIVDLDLEAVEWTRRWIAKVGDEWLKPPARR
ncbi:MAG: exo-alpha-sialidase [Planctomycetes bacterium]|nr:exo-alpha-sialidase [Planctomycetota bacterium]